MELMIWNDQNIRSLELCQTALYKRPSFFNLLMNGIINMDVEIQDHCSAFNVHNIWLSSSWISWIFSLKDA